MTNKIDWTKPLELMDGTPVVLADGSEILAFGSTNPDRHGDYWIKREDGLPIDRCDIWCVGPDGLGMVRNRADAPA